MKSFNLIKNNIGPIISAFDALYRTGKSIYNIYDFANSVNNGAGGDGRAGKGIDIAQKGLEMITTPLAAVPVIGPVIGEIPTAARYITDVVDGRKNGPPALEPGREKDNSIGNIGHEVVNSTAFKQFFSNFGNWTAPT
jgi:hypothetical protein